MKISGEVFSSAGLVGNRKASLEMRVVKSSLPSEEDSNRGVKGVLRLIRQVITLMKKETPMATLDSVGKTVKFKIEKETKYTVRYNEYPEEGQPPVIGTLYVQKWFAGDATEIEVTVRKV